MSESLKTAFISILFVFICVIIHDLGQAELTKIVIKDTLDLSTKAAALQLDENVNNIGKGEFNIDVDKAKQVNNEIIKANLGTSSEYTISTDIINAHTETNYTSPDNIQFVVNNPTVFSNIKYKYEGIFYR